MYWVVKAMDAIDAMIAATNNLIAENPSEISIHRTEYIEDENGGRKKVEITLPPFSGRLVPSAAKPQMVRDEAGGLVRASWTLIAPSEADIRVGSDVEDTFIVNGQTFKVVGVIYRKWHDQAYAIHAEAEVML